MGFGLIDCGEGKAGFAGSVRGPDEAGHDTFEIQLPSRRPLYGEYRPNFADNHNDFDIEIVSFGFDSHRNVGNDHPGARQLFSATERVTIQRLTVSLITNPEAQKGMALFSSTQGSFLGQVHFASGWIRMKLVQRLRWLILRMQ